MEEYRDFKRNLTFGMRFQYGFYQWVDHFFGRKKLLSLFLPAQIIYPFYIIIIGAIAPFGTYLWKERKVK